MRIHIEEGAYLAYVSGIFSISCKKHIFVSHDQTPGSMTHLLFNNSINNSIVSALIKYLNKKNNICYSIKTTR